MRLRIKIDELKNMLSKMYFANEGVEEEKKYWALFKERFPNLEIFWRQFIVPATRRIENGENQASKNAYREGVHDSIKRIVELHYSIFKNMLFCWQDSEDYRRRRSYFYDFWAHLVSTLDLTEMFLLTCYALKLESWGEEINTPKLDKDTFLDSARKWYNERYPREYTRFLGEWKPVTWSIQRRMDLLANYFGCSKELDDYSRYSQGARTYRNCMVHSTGFANMKILTGNLGHLVPRKDRIRDYKGLIWSEQMDRILDKQEDAIPSVQLMKLEFDSVQDILNKLWTRRIHDTEKLFESRNEILQQKYNIELL